MIKVSIPAQENKELKPNIVVIGVGGAGGNAVDNMITNGLEGVNFVICNTDAQALAQSQCQNRVQLGAGITQGLGAGSDPDVGRAAAEESIDDVMAHLEGMNMAFITCGMGGGTGTGAASVIARAAREKGILTVGVVTKPFKFEGANRMRLAENGIEEMQDYVDTLIVIPNQNLFRIANEKTTFAEAFKMADGVLQSGVRGVTDLMIKPGMINLDFADVRCTMREMGKAMMGTGEASGENRAVEAAEAAISNPLLDDISMKGARGVIINITGGYDMTLMEVDEVCNRIGDEVDDNANIIFGSTFDDRLEGVIRVSVVATGIESDEVRSSKPLRPAAINTATQSRTQDDNAPQRVKPLAASSNEGGQIAQDQSHQGSFGQTSVGQGKMPSAMPSTPSHESMPEQKVVGSDVAYDASAFSASGTANSRFQPAQSNMQNALSQSQTAPNSYMSQPQTGYAEALRGERHGTAFIPPRAAQPADMDAPSSPQPTQTQNTAQSEPSAPFGFAPQGQHGQNQSGRSQPQTQSEPKPQGLKLNPPTLPTPDMHARKAPSLFERMTGMVKQFTGHEEVDDFSAPQQYQTTAPQSRQQPAPQMQTAPQQSTGQKPVQGQLDITMPAQDSSQSQKSNNQDDLDIPAFLRRQAN